MIYFGDIIRYIFLENSVEAGRVKCLCRIIRTMLISFVLGGKKIYVFFPMKGIKNES